MSKKLFPYAFVGILAIAIATISTSCNNKNKPVEEEGYVGSKSCRECHDAFYKLWEPSFHGLAMQPITKEFLQKDSIPSSDTFHIEGSIFQAKVKRGTLTLIEEVNGKKKKYQAMHATGGKYIHYFLIPMEKGKLQVMPIAYDLRKKEWYNNPQSGVRHFVDGDEDAPLDWMNPVYTFNSNCIACHASQYDIGYDMATNTYHSVWQEPGINCEACHGPSGEHEKVCREAPEGEVQEDMKLIMTHDMDQERDNSSCLICHAQSNPVTSSFLPGERFYDHYNLVTLEDVDHYPDGRDLGENFTMTTWQMNKCNINKDFTCMGCHTSSGRYRFADDEIANNACMPCHQERVENPESHTHHESGKNGIKCINCHMPTTDFARMDRSDHSNRPPMPKATIEFDSPNACNICHDDETPEWANKHVEEWHDNKYQDATIYKAQLIRLARKQDWSRVNEIFDYIKNNPEDEIYLTSFIRLLDTYTNADKWETILNESTNESPLVRSAVAHSLEHHTTINSKSILLTLINDDYRIVRIEAGYSMHRWDKQIFNAEELEQCQKGITEYKESMTSRPDDWASHYNLGIYYTEVNDFPNAVKSYKNSLNINENELMTNVNLGMTFAYSQNYTSAELYLNKALEIDPNNEIALVNYALLMVEMNNIQKAETTYRKAYKINNNLAQAAYNIAIMVSERNMAEAEQWARKAMEAAPSNSTYQYSYAFYLTSNNKKYEAVTQLIALIESNPYYVDAYMMLAQLYHENGDSESAKKLLNKGLLIPEIDAQAKAQINRLLNQMSL